MALKMTKRGQLDNEVAYEFVCDTTADLQAIDPKYITMGSVATVIEGDAGFEVYMANSQKEWINLGSAANSGGDSSGNSNNSTPAWVNQDIIVSIPETVSVETANEPALIQSNIQLNNHVITGNILNAYEYQGEYTGLLGIKIDPSLISSFLIDNIPIEISEDIASEWYIICLYMPVPDSGMENVPAGMTEAIGPVNTILNESNDSSYNLTINVGSEASLLKIYKVPGYIISNMWNSPYLLSYSLSNIQPEAIYDISQLTYIPQEAGE